jgi:hypothetical protein
MLGNAVSSRTPTDFHPSPAMGCADSPLMNRHTPNGVDCGCPYAAVGVHKALHSPIDLHTKLESRLAQRGVIDPGGREQQLHRPHPSVA